MPRLQCNQGQQKEHKHTQIVAECELRSDSVINGALAEEVRREEQKRRRSDRAAAEVTETESSAPAASGPRENPIEPDPNPKRRLTMNQGECPKRMDGT